MFEFRLNNTLVTEPKNWDTAMFKILRDSEMPGLFTEVIADLVFYADGYELLKNLYDTTDGCVLVDVNITNNCGFDFDGVIYLSDVSFDTKKCQAKADVEDNTGAGIIMRLKETTVQINGGKSLNGSALTDIGENLAVGGVVGTKQWYRLGDVMQYCLDYISNSQIIIDSNFLNTTPYRPRRIQITVTSSGASGVFQSTWNTIYGGVNGVFGTIAGGLTSVQVATRISQLLNGQGQIFGGGANEANGLWPIYADNNGTNVIEVMFFGQETFLTFTAFPAATFAINTIETPSYGAENVYITSGAVLNNQIEALFVSFNQVFNAVGAWYNLSVRPYEMSGQKYLQIEQEPFFFENTQVAEVDNFDSINIEKQDIYSFSVLNYRQSSRDLNSFLHQDISYIGQPCSSNTINAQSEFNVPTANMPTNPTEVNAKDVVIVEKWSPGGVPSIRGYLSSWFNGTSIQTGTYYAASVVHPFVAKNFSNRAPSGMTLQGINVPNNNNPKIKSVASFSAVITNTQLNAIRANTRGYILVNGVKMWIRSIEYSIKSGKTTFELLTE